MRSFKILCFQSCDFWESGVWRVNRFYYLECLQSSLSCCHADLLPSTFWCIRTHFLKKQKQFYCSLHDLKLCSMLKYKKLLKIQKLYQLLQHQEFRLVLLVDFCCCCWPKLCKKFSSVKRCVWLEKARAIAGQRLCPSCRGATSPASHVGSC